MDKPSLSFEEAVQFAKRLRAALEASGPTPADQVATIYRSKLEDLIDVSKDSRTHWDALKSSIEQRRRRGEPLSPKLNDWAVDAFAGIQPRPAARGRDPYQNGVRNELICLAVEALVSAGFNPTRNRETGNARGRACAAGGTACDAVGTAWDLGYRDVLSIWESFHRLDKVLSRVAAGCRARALASIGRTYANPAKK